MMAMTRGNTGHDFVLSETQVLELFDVSNHRILTHNVFNPVETIWFGRGNRDVLQGVCGCACVCVFAIICASDSLCVVVKAPPEGAWTELYVDFNINGSDICVKFNSLISICGSIEGLPSRWRCQWLFRTSTFEFRNETSHFCHFLRIVLSRSGN